MILLIDVGNTNICITSTNGSVIEDKIIRIKTLHDRMSDEYYLILKDSENNSEFIEKTQFAIDIIGFKLF